MVGLADWQGFRWLPSSGLPEYPRRQQSCPPFYAGFARVLQAASGISCSTFLAAPICVRAAPGQPDVAHGCVERLPR